MKIINLTNHSLRRGSAPDIHDKLYEFHYFYAGKGTFYNGREAYAFNVPTLFYTPPGTRHHVRVARDTPAIRFFCMFFRWPRAPKNLRARLRERFFKGSALPSGTYLPYIENLKRLTDTENALLKQAADLRFHSLVYELCADIPVPKSDYDNPHVARAAAILRTMTHTSLDVATLARTLNLNPSYFSRLFGKHTGKTPSRFLLDEKIEAAAWFLLNTDDTISKIADDLKFYDEFHFSRAFKKKKGVSPRTFREQAGR